MKSQLDQIKEANFAYILLLNPHSKGLTDRYAIYTTQAGGELEVVWPGDADRYEENSGEELKKPKLLPNQYHDKNSNSKYPAFHFKLSGYGYSKVGELGAMLKRINPDIQVLSISGYAPSSGSL